MIGEISQGWFNLARKELGKLDPAIQESATNRFATCLKCENYTKVKTCRACGCYLPAKVLVKNAICPKKFW